MKDKILIDLTRMGNPTCGFGTIARSYEELFAAYEGDEFEFIFLIPKGYLGRFRDKVDYIEAPRWGYYFDFLLPEVKIWHTTTQQVKYLRLTKHTRQVLTIHDLNFLYEKPWYSILKHRYRMRRYIQKASAVTAISEYVKQDILRNIKVNRKEIKVIYNGVAPIDGKPAEQPSFFTGRPFFFTIGQIRRKKNFHVLLEMMEHFPEYDLYICGDDHFEYAGQLRNLLREKGMRNSFVTGVVTDAEKVWLYRNCHAFLFPSLLEGFGIPVLEAMQFKKPVFSSACSSLPEICGPFAYLWDNFDAASMAAFIREKLPEFYADPFRMDAARQYALSFTYERHVEEYLQIYRELLRQSIR